MLITFTNLKGIYKNVLTCFQTFLNFSPNSFSHHRNQGYFYICPIQLEGMIFFLLMPVEYKLFMQSSIIFTCMFSFQLYSWIKIIIMIKTWLASEYQQNLKTILLYFSAGKFVVKLIFLAIIISQYKQSEKISCLILINF